jgi:hypothetical protein
MSRLALRVGLLVLSCCALVMIGCGGSDRPRLGKVNGTVEYNGQPVEQGELTFYPEAGRAAAAKIVDGQIQNVTTFDPNDGAPLGTLKVTVISFDNPEADMYTARKNLLPAKYSTVQSTDLTVEIAPGENSVALELHD